MSLDLSFNELIALADTYIWYIASLFLLGGGLYLTYKFKGVQFTHIVDSFKLSFFGTKSSSEQSVSSGEAFWVGIGARIGIGKIAGVATAIIFGGPGAVFWLWAFSLISCASCFAECTLGQIFKDKKSDGLFHGGPAYYIRDGLKSPKFGAVIAILLIVTYAFGFTGIQSSSATTAFSTAFDFEGNSLMFVLLLSALVSFIMVRGVKGVAKTLAKFVPIISVIWFGMVIITVVFNWNYIGDAFRMIITEAFNMNSMLWGMAAAMIWGLKRSVFSNTAGIGCIPNVSSAADVRHPVEQGLSQSFGVILDTLICTGTALIILASPNVASLIGIEDGVQLVSASLAAGPFGAYAPALLSFIILLFVVVSIVSSYSICEVNLKYLTEKPVYSLLLKAAMIATVFFLGLVPSNLIWSISDILMATLGIVNITAVILLKDYVIEALRDYNRQRAANKVPEFNKSRITLDVEGITMWGERTEVEIKTEPET